MGTWGELITQAYTEILDIGSDAAASVEFRSRIGLHARRAVSAMWTYRAWPWTFAASGACSALAGESSMFAPEDFGSFGPYTKLWRLQSPGLPDPAHIFYRQPTVVRNRLLAYSDASADRPEMWTFLGQGKLEKPAAPVITQVGTPGITPFSYKVVALRSIGGAHTEASLVGSTTTGNAAPSVTNFNRVTWAAVSGAVAYDVYRTVGGASPPYKIASATTALTFDDTAPSSGTQTTPPVTNTTNSKLIVFAPKLSLDTDFELVDYRIKEPEFVDEYLIDPADVVGGEGDSLKLIPEQYHESVLLDYIRGRLMGDEGDDREPLAFQDFKLALRDAWAEENQALLGAEMFPPGYYGHGSVED